MADPALVDPAPAPGSPDAGAAGPEIVPAAPVSTSGYAVVRVAALVPATPEPAADRLRELVRRQVSDRLAADRLAGPVGDALHALAAGTPDDVRHRVLLPLRRDVHNARSPRPALRAALGDLPDRVPLLHTWLGLRDRLDRADAELAAATPAGLAADRRALAAACRSEPLRRGIALTGEDLLRAVDRAAALGDAPDKRARGSEPSVLRHVLRAETKTSPVTWFAAVGWGSWAAAADPGTDLDPALPAAGHAQPDRALLDGLVDALLRIPAVRDRSPHHLAPGLWLDEREAVFRRPAEGVREEEVRLPLTGPLRHLVARLRGPGTHRPGELAADLAARLPLPPPRAADAATRYVAGLVGEGLLRPHPPLDPQDLDPVPTLARWAADVAGRPDTAAALLGLGAAVRAFPETPAADRPAALAALRAGWRDVFAGLDAEPVDRRLPLTEDVTVRPVLRLGARHGRDAVPDLARLAPLFEVFDLFTVIRRAARDRFVARYGPGGRCDVVADFAVEYADLWRAHVLVEGNGTVRDPATAGPGLAALGALRAALAAAARRRSAGGEEVVLDDDLVDAAWTGLPRWARDRPVSHSVFAQPLPGPGPARLVVNRVYGGWGRFTSRFLPYLDPAAAAAVTDRLAAALGRPAQIRPVAGFNANLHPLLTGQEVSEHPAVPGIRPAELRLVHDVATDQLRLQLRVTGEPVDVLYLGFLVPVGMPERLVPLLNDLGSGLVDLAPALAPARPVDTPVGTVRTRPRLRYRGVVLARRRWWLDPATAARWQAELEADRDAPVRVAARWRAALGLPEHVYVSAAAGTGGSGAADLAALLAWADRAKPQLVDLGSALHARGLARLLGRYGPGLTVEEALPAPAPGRRAVELTVETYRSCR